MIDNIHQYSYVELAVLKIVQNFSDYYKVEQKV